MAQKTFKITDEAGLHARPATILVNTSSKFADTELNLTSGDKNVNLKSIMGVMSLGIKQNEEITIIAEGGDEEAALNELERVLKENGLTA